MLLDDLAGLPSSFWFACLQRLYGGRFVWTLSGRVAALQVERPEGDVLVLVGRADASRFRAILSTPGFALQNVTRVRVLPVAIDGPPGGEGPAGEPPKRWTAAALGLPRRVKVGVWDRFVPDALANLEVRRRFGAWLSDDPLALSFPDDRAVWERWLVAMLREELHPRLDGQQSDPNRVQLSRVFVDLPAGREIPGYLRELLRMAAGARHPQTPRRAAMSKGGRTNVLIAGPGQGKTTLGQYSCLIHRAALLGKSKLDAGAAEILASLGKIEPAVRCRRIPFRVVLDRFARRLAEGKVATVVEYVTWEAERAGAPLDAALVTLAIQHVPTLWWFDGLDEVPASANRPELVAAIQAFIAAAENVNADFVVVATTRPQGYQGEFGGDSEPDGPRTHSLSPIPPELASNYAHLLLQERFPRQPIRRAEINERFARALAVPETAALARSPLQVTVLVTLLERIAVPPRDRWRLFRRYYDVITDREREKELAINAVLEEHPDLVDRLHAEVGYELHVLAEGREATDTLMPEQRFQELAQGLLRGRGHGEEEVKAIGTRLCATARDRLVFLVSPVLGTVGFEIRSLQEMFAASRLMEGTDGQIRDRLPVIAGLTHWQNVFGFAVGNVMATRAPLAPELPKLVLEDPIGGPWVAVDLLSEGLATRWPLLADLLWNEAGRLLSSLETGPEFLRLLAVDENRAIASISAGLRGGERGAWSLLIQAARVWGDDKSAVAAAAREHWAHLDANSRRLVLAEGVVDAIEDWGLDALAAVVWTLPWEVHAWGPESAPDSPGEARAPVLACHDALVPVDTELLAARDVPGLYLSRWCPASAHSEFWTGIRALPDRPPNGAHPDWSPAIALGAFLREPTIAGLEKALSAIDARTSCEALVQGSRIAPLPLAIALAHLAGFGPPKERTQLAASSWGDSQEWMHRGVPWEDPVPALLYSIEDTTNDALAERLAYATDVGPALMIGSAIRIELLPAEAAPFWELVASAPAPRAHAAARLLWRAASRSGMSDVWIARLDRVGRHLTSFWTDSRSDEFWQYLGPDRPGLYPFALGLLERMDSPSQRILQPAAQLPQPLDVDEVLVRLRLADGITLQLDADAQTIARSFSANGWLRGLGVLAALPWPALSPILTAVLSSLSSEASAARVRVEGLRHQAWSSRASGLGDAALGRRLDLPVLYGVSLPSLASSVYDRVVLDQLSIANFRGIDSLERSFIAPRSACGQWIFVVGENGVGKTSVLRALALVLSPLSVIRDSLPLTRQEGPIVRGGADRAAVALTLQGGSQRSLTLMDGDVQGHEPSQPHFIAAYGPRRGNTLQAGAERREPTPWEAIHSLFEPQSRLINAATWLQRAERLRDDAFGRDALPAVHAVLEKRHRSNTGVQSVQFRTHAEMLGRRSPAAPRNRVHGVPTDPIRPRRWRGPEGSPGASASP